MKRCGLCKKRTKELIGSFLIQMHRIATEDKEYKRIGDKQYEIVRYCKDCLLNHCLGRKEDEKKKEEN